jgi:hypothetical protein
MDDMYRIQAPNFVCTEISDYKDFKENNYQFTGCGKYMASLYMISF